MTAPIVEHADTVVVKERAGFLDESPGVKSSTRLIMVWLTVLASVIVLTLSYYVVYLIRHDKAVDQSVVLALSAALTAVVLNGAVAIIRRNGGEP